MVKFLFAKEKMRVRFPLSAQDQVIFEYAKGLGIVGRDSVVSLPPLFPFLPPPQGGNQLLVNRAKPPILG